MWVVWLDSGSVNTQKFNWFRVSTFSLIDGDEMEDSVVSEAVDGQPKADGHDGRVEIGRAHV